MTPTSKFNLSYTFQRLTPFFSVWAAYAFGLLVLLASLGYYESFLYLNGIRLPFLDQFMPHFTHFGEGVLLASLFCLLIFYKDRAMVHSLLIALVVTGITLYSLKNFVFMGWDRPPTVFKDFEAIFYMTLGGERYNSFPSGHSAAIWMLMTFISYYLSASSIGYQLLCGAFAVAVAYSRVYIGVHFPADILVGSTIGILISLLSLSYVYPFFLKRNRAGQNKLTVRSIFLLCFLILLLVGSMYLLHQQYYSG